MVGEAGRTATEVAELLGIGVDLIYRWRREMQLYGHIAFPSQGNESLTGEQQRIKELEKQLKDAELDQDIF